MSKNNAYMSTLQNEIEDILKNEGFNEMELRYEQRFLKNETQINISTDRNDILIRINQYNKKEFEIRETLIFRCIDIETFNAYFTIFLSLKTV